MKLIRIIALEGIRRNWKVVVRYVKSADNLLSNALSHFKMSTFWDNAPSTMAWRPDEIPHSLKPVTKIWDSKVDYLNQLT